MKKIKRANSIEVGYEVCDKKFIFNYVIDKKNKGHILVEFPFAINKFPHTLYNHLAMSCVVVLSSLVLPKKIILSFPVPQKINFLKAITLVYDIRSYSEGMGSLDSPELFFEHEDKCHVEMFLRDKNATLFWSGGLDSTYAYILLKKNNYKVNLIHSDINIDQSVEERRSVAVISEKIKAYPEFLHIEFPDLKKIGKRYSNKFSSFPSYNSIPFGRDVIHLFAGIFFNMKYKSKFVCFGHEYELWKNYIEASGKIICRNDFQGERGCLLLNRMIKNINKQLHIFSPIAALSKLNIYRSLSEHKDIFENVTYCYFSSKYKKCGKCNNCLTYQDLEKVIAGEEGNWIEAKKALFAKNIVSKETFGELMYLHFFQVIQEKKYNRRYEEILKKKFGKTINKTKSQILKKLEKVNKVKLTPSDFEY